MGPVYTKAEAKRIAKDRGWTVARDGDSYRRVVASPRPLRILEIDVIRLLMNQGVVVICAGGGGIPVVRRADGAFTGIEAVIDKDLASGLLAATLNADAFLMLTDVAAVYTDWGTPQQKPIGDITAAALGKRPFAAGSMGPKVQAACDFVQRTGGMAEIGALDAALGILEGTLGTRVAVSQTRHWCLGPLRRLDQPYDSGIGAFFGPTRGHQVESIARVGRTAHRRSALRH